MIDAFVRQMLYPVPRVRVGRPPRGVEDVVLASATGERVHAWAGGDPRRPRRRPAAILFHGNGENLETMRQAGLFEEVAELEAVWLAVDYPGYGRSTGSPSEEGIHAGADAALEWVRRRHPGRPVVAWGWSIGAAVAVQLAVRHPDEVDALALLSPWTRLAEVATVHFPLPFAERVLAGRYDSLAVAGRVRAPAFVCHGVRDRIVPFEQGERIARALGGVVRWLPIREAGHNDLLAVAKVWAGLRKFFDEVAAGLGRG